MKTKITHCVAITLFLLVEVISFVVLDRVAVPRQEQELAEDREDGEETQTCRASEAGPVSLPGAETH